MPNRFAPVIDFTTTTSPDASTLSSGSATLTPTTFDYQHSHREELTTIVTVKDGKLPVIHFSPIEMASTLTCGDPSSTPDGQPTRTSTPPSSHSSPASSTPLIHHSRFSSSEPVIPTGSSMPGQQPSSTPLPPGSPHPPGSTSATSSAAASGHSTSGPIPPSQSSSNPTGVPESSTLLPSGSGAGTSTGLVPIGLSSSGRAGQTSIKGPSGSHTPAPSVAPSSQVSSVDLSSVPDPNSISALGANLQSMATCPQARQPRSLGVH